MYRAKKAKEKIKATANIYIGYVYYSIYWN